MKRPLASVAEGPLHTVLHAVSSSGGHVLEGAGPLASESGVDAPGRSPGAQDVTTAVTTHTVHVGAAADEEYRAKYGSSGWLTEVNPGHRNGRQLHADVIRDQHGSSSSFVNYDSGPDASRSACNVRTELATEIGLAGYDMVAGFSTNGTSGPTGCNADAFDVDG